MFHAVETSVRFACERKVFEYEYILILNVSALKQGKCEHQYGISTFYSLSLNMEVFEYY